MKRSLPCKQRKNPVLLEESWPPCVQARVIWGKPEATQAHRLQIVLSSVKSSGDANMNSGFRMLLEGVELRKVDWNGKATTSQ